MDDAVVGNAAVSVPSKRLRSSQRSLASRFAEIAERMGIKRNYLYRVLPSLADDGRVKKDGRGWHPIETA